MIFIPTIYLSPSTQEFNPYFGGGNEEEYMNLVADAMIPYLNATGINYLRNTPEMTAASSIRESNNNNIDFHLALHSNASGSAAAGSVRGAEFYYYPNSTNGQRAAQIFANNFKEIYPLPERVRTVPTTTLGEVVRTRAPSVLAEVAYHDNPEDAQWIRDNIDTMAENLVISLADYFGIPFNTPSASERTAVVTTLGSNLNIRAQPNINSPRIGSIPNGTSVAVYYDTGEWSLIKYGDTTGYVNNKYLK